MKLKIRSDETSMLQMNDWLAELRDDGHAEPRDDGHAEPPADGRSEPPADDRAESPAYGRAEPPSGGASLEAPTEPEPATPTGTTVRAVIGDHLRMPTMWCEMGSCVSRHADPAALGEGDARARAIAAGWRIDAFGRLACPRCQQTDPRFRAPGPVVQWDRHTAIARTAQVATAHGDPTARTQRF